MINSTDFTKRLEEILDFYGLSATAFAEKIDFNRSTISHLLSGRNKPSLEFVMKLLEKFPEVEMQWLLYGKGTFPTSEKQEPFSEKSEVKKTKPTFGKKQRN
jgi:plasmid maintenance system antidote protein VapI